MVVLYSLPRFLVSDSRVDPMCIVHVSSISSSAVKGLRILGLVFGIFTGELRSNSILKPMLSKPVKIRGMLQTWKNHKKSCAFAEFQTFEPKIVQSFVTVTFETFQCTFLVPQNRVHTQKQFYFKNI